MHATRIRLKQKTKFRLAEGIARGRFPFSEAECKGSVIRGRFPFSEASAPFVQGKRQATYKRVWIGLDPAQRRTLLSEPLPQPPDETFDSRPDDWMTG